MRESGQEGHFEPNRPKDAVETIGLPARAEAAFLIQGLDDRTDERDAP